MTKEQYLEKVSKQIKRKKETIPTHVKVDYKRENSENHVEFHCNQYESLILACNANDFNNKLTDLVASKFGNLALNWNTHIMAIQFKDADEYAMAPLIDSYRRSDGQYVREGEFLTRQEVHDKVQPFCKRICISIAPKDFGDNQEHPLEDYYKKYGYIHFTQINTIK